MKEKEIKKVDVLLFPRYGKTRGSFREVGKSTLSTNGSYSVNRPLEIVLLP